MSNTKTPLLIISDAPSASSGLGRICRDLATRIATELSDIYEVATLGYGGTGDKNLPFFQFPIEGMHDWYIPSLRSVWENFAGDRKGVVLTIWDASRLLWFARPDTAGWCPDKEMREWLLSKPFEKWGYFPMDAEGPRGMLSRINSECLLGFDRIIAYSDWAKGTIERTLSPLDSEKRQLTAIPHGIDTSVFRPYNPRAVRGVFRNDMQFNGPVIEEYDKIVGIVATNQTRKDYGMAIEALALVAQDTAIRIFIQTDILERHWSLPGLLFDFNVLHRCIINTVQVSDEVMAKAYSACDLTLGIGPEGFGYPGFESLACGTPVIAGSLGGHAEHMEESMLIAPVATRIETCYNAIRPVFDPKAWEFWIRKALKKEKETETRFSSPNSLLPPRLEWNNLWKDEWEPYFRTQHRILVEPKEPILVQTNSIPQTDNYQEESSRSIVAFPVGPGE